jgi:hypothetical protein
VGAGYMGDTLWSVRGSVASEGHAALIARLSSLCDGCPVYTSPLHYYDRVYSAEKATRNGGAVSLRAREHLLDGSSEMLYLGPVVRPPPSLPITTPRVTHKVQPNVNPKPHPLDGCESTRAR